MQSHKFQTMSLSQVHSSNLVKPFVDFYDHLTLHIVPGPRSPKYFLPLALIFVGLLVPRSKLDHNQLRWTFLPVIYAIQAYVWAVDNSFDVISMNAMLCAFMLLGWYDVHKDFKKVLHQKLPQERPDQDKCMSFQLEPYPDAFTLRLLWVLDLMSAIRLTGWDSPANARRGLPTRPWKDTISSFYLSTIFKAILLLIVLDITSSYVTTSPSFVLHTSKGAIIPPLLEAVIFLVHLGGALALYNAFLPIGITTLLAPFPRLRDNPSISPLCWPAHFGSFSSIWDITGSSSGLRAFWAIFWHQNMRYITSTPGIALASVLRLETRSKMRYLLIVSTSFFLSGVVHMGVIPPKPLGTLSSCWQLRMQMAAFFWLQPVGIGIELLPWKTMSRAKKGPKWLFKAVAIIWTLLYLLLTAWWTVRLVGREMKWWDYRLVPFPLLSSTQTPLRQHT